MSKLQSKPKLVAAAADLLRRRGLQATSVRELARHANAPLGSVYHYFPAGKAEFVQQAIELTATHVEAQLTECLSDGPIAGFQRYFAHWRTLLQSSDFSAGCPLAALALDAHAITDAPAAFEQTGATFDRLQQLIAQHLSHAGIADAKANSLAMSIIALTEGAILICRTQRQFTALDSAEQTILQLLETAFNTTINATETTLVGMDA